MSHPPYNTPLNIINIGRRDAKYLDIKDHDKKDNAPVIAWKFNTQSGQKWNQTVSRPSPSPSMSAQLRASNTYLQWRFQPKDGFTLTGIILCYETGKYLNTLNFKDPLNIATV
jgi:hypothetical protein